MVNDWLDAEQVLERLGIRPQTLYAYVSRGRIEAAAHPDDPRRSLYRASDVAALAQRKARGRRAADVAAEAIAWGEPVLPSAITTVEGGRLYYRGHDAAELALTHSLEDTARLLRGGHGAQLSGQRSPRRDLAGTSRVRLFRSSHQRIRASSRPWVIHSSPGRSSSTGSVSSSQSAWSEMTRGSSTPFCRARARTCIQPEAKAVTGSGKRRLQRSCRADGRSDDDLAGEVGLGLGAPWPAPAGRGRCRAARRAG
jgi:hypothetical protein